MELWAILTGVLSILQLTHSLSTIYSSRPNVSAPLPIESWKDYKVMFMYAHIDGKWSDENIYK